MIILCGVGGGCIKTLTAFYRVPCIRLVLLFSVFVCLLLESEQI